MKTITFLVFTLFIQSCIAGENCNNPETQYEINLCSGNKLKNLEKELEIKINSISEHLKKIEGENKFFKSNKAWFKFRNLHCESVSHIYETGSIHSLVESECKIMLTKERLNNIGIDYKDTLNTILKGSPSANK